jgi:hypothetical protein
MAESTPEDIASYFAALRGQKQEEDRRIVEALHPAEPEPERDQEAEEFIQRLFAPKPADIEVIRRIHGTEEQ